MSYEDCNSSGGMTAYNWEHDPKRLAFQYARYKFVAKMLEGKESVLEVGCADGMGARIVRQHVNELMAVDADEAAIQIARELSSARWPVRFQVLDILSHAIREFDAVYCLDLFEHIAQENEDLLLGNLRLCAPVAIIGTPSIQSQRFASEISLREHVNCVSKAGLRERMQRHWTHVFMFGMNDETLHVGHDGMTHYLFGIGCA